MLKSVRNQNKYKKKRSNSSADEAAKNDSKLPKIESDEN